ncbi:MAG: hypothetical protein Q8941_03740 [Bacteroidota bacterium]|nr:hypothetical protein [Bacteroidota bacterium]
MPTYGYTTVVYDHCFAYYPEAHYMFSSVHTNNILVMIAGHAASAGQLTQF